MLKESSDMTFWPVTVRPPDQLELDVGEQSPWPRLQAHLAETYGGRSIGFEDLLNEDYRTGFWVEREYREAIVVMEGDERATVQRRRSTPSGRAPRGLQLDDEVTFSLAQMTLG
jgi:hypothetical protein